MKNKILKEVRVPRDERVEVYKDDLTLVIRPLTHRASCKYGHGTPWCTAVPSNETHFDQYTADGELYYVILYKEDADGNRYEFYKLALFKKSTTKNESWYDIKDKRVYNIDMFKQFILKPEIEQAIRKDFEEVRPRHLPKFQIGDYAKKKDKWRSQTFISINTSDRISLYPKNIGGMIVVKVNPKSVILQLADIHIPKQEIDNAEQYPERWFSKKVREMKIIQKRMREGERFITKGDPYKLTKAVRLTESQFKILLENIIP